MGWAVARMRVVVAAGLTVAACVGGDPAVPVAATRINGEAALAVPLCDGESVDWIELRDTRSQDGEGPVAWRIDATRPSWHSTFIIGEPLPDFDETVPLVTLPDRQMTAVVMTTNDVELIGAVDFDDVEEGKLYVDLQQRRSMSGIVDDRYC
jgi:hypothetical protein